MRHGTQLLLWCLATVWTFTPTSVYLQAIDRIIQKLLDNMDASVSDYNTLCENIEVYKEHSTEFLRKLKVRDPQFRQIAIEHCRVGKPEFPDVLNIHAFQLNLGWNDTQAANMFELVNSTRHLWMAFEDVGFTSTVQEHYLLTHHLMRNAISVVQSNGSSITNIINYLTVCYQMHVKLTFIAITVVAAYFVHALKTSTYVRALDKVICEFLGKLKHEDYRKLCDYIESYNNLTREFVDKLTVKDPEFRGMAIVHCDWGKPEFPKYHDRIWYEVWMEWNDTHIDQLDLLVNTTTSLWSEYKRLCKHSNYSRYLDRFNHFSNSSEILLVD